MNARRATLSIALGGGLLLRLAALPLPGAGDVDPWKVWSYHAVTDGVTALYGTGSPPSQVDFRFHDKIVPVNYRRSRSTSLAPPGGCTPSQRADGFLTP